MRKMRARVSAETKQDAARRKMERQRDGEYAAPEGKRQTSLHKLGSQRHVCANLGHQRAGEAWSNKNTAFSVKRELGIFCKVNSKVFDNSGVIFGKWFFLAVKKRRGGRDAKRPRDAQRQTDRGSPREPEGARGRQK